MNATEEMSKPLSAAAVSAILSHGKWQGSDKIRLTCTHRTEPVLRKAGVLDPKPLEEYDVPVKREGGLIVIDRDRHHFPPAPAGDASLFEPGGLFAGDPSPVDAGGIQSAIAATRDAFHAAINADPETGAAFDLLCEISRTRTFEIPTGPQSKIRVQILAFEDESLPSPNERDRWVPRKPSNVDCHAAVAALRMARDLSNLEQL